MSKILDDKTIQLIIDKYTKPNVFGIIEIPLPQNIINSVPRIFKFAMNENRFKNLSNLEQQTLVQNILYDFAVSKDLTEEKEKIRHSDVYHLEVYNVFLEEGQSDKITDVLHNFDISTEALKGVKFTSTDTYEVPLSNGQKFEVYVQTENQDGSPVVLEFDMILNGEYIYKWNRKLGSYFNKDIDKEEYIISKYKSKYEGKIYIDEEKYISKWVDKNNKTRYRDEKGRFVKYDS